MIVGILGIMAYLSVPMYNSYRIRSDHRLAASHTQQGINRARLLAQNREQNSNWGFFIPNGTLYKGVDYPSRDPSYDEMYPMPSNIAVQGVLDVSFDAQGNPSETGDVTLTAITDDEAVIPIRFNVAVNTLVTEATDSLVICDNGVTRTIVEAAWPSYQAGGAVLNACVGGSSSTGGTSSGGASSGTSSGGVSSSGGTSSGGVSSGASSVGTSSSTATSSSVGSSVGTSSSITPPPSSSSIGTSSSAGSSVGTSSSSSISSIGSSVASSGSSGTSSSSSSVSSVSLCAGKVTYFPSSQTMRVNSSAQVRLTSEYARYNFGTLSNPPLTSGLGPQVLVHWCYGQNSSSSISSWSPEWSVPAICNGNPNTYAAGNAVSYNGQNVGTWRNLTANTFFSVRYFGRYRQQGWMQVSEAYTPYGNSSNLRLLRNGDSLPSNCHNGCSILRSALVSRGLANPSGIVTISSCELLAVVEGGDAPTGTSAGDDWDDAVLRLTFQ